MLHHELFLTWTSLVASTLAQYGSTSNGAGCGYLVGAPVKTTSGTVHGIPADNATQVSTYLGIPYAQPPVGALRFAPPVRFTGAQDIQANSFRHDCPANKSPVPTSLPPNVFNILTDIGLVDEEASEDCLYMNIWSKPQTGSPKKPVLVWIYGGGFQIGGTNTTSYSGQFWADTEDVVIVNFNYRLNIFGFPGAPSLEKNVGLLDQRMAIEWVKDNIEAFGGDPDRITIFGQSAGSASVDYYNYIWLDDPIIAGSIMQSGTAQAFGNAPLETTQANWYNVTRQLGCGDNSTNTEDELLTCMRSDKITQDALLKATIQPMTLTGGLGMFAPTIDEKTVFQNYTDRGLKGQFIKRPYIIGNNDYEAGSFKLLVAGSNVTIPEEQWTLFDLSTFTCPASTAAKFRVLNNVPVWRYRYFGMYPNLQFPTSIDRAYHGSEILPMYSSSEQITKQDSTWEERSIGTLMRSAWSAFARCPYGGLESFGWPRYSDTTESLVLIGQGNSTSVSFSMPDVYDTCDNLPEIQSPTK